LDVPDIGAALQEVGRAGVTQAVRGEPPRQIGVADVAPYHVDEVLRGERIAALGEEQELPARFFLGSERGQGGRAGAAEEESGRSGGNG
jgi:hypothetical protein